MEINTTMFLNITDYNITNMQKFDMAKFVYDNCKHYNDFLIDTIIICAILFFIIDIIPELLTELNYKKIKESDFYKHIKNVVFTFYGIFFIIESYIFIDNMLNDSQRNVFRYAIGFLTFFVGLLLLKSSYKYIKSQKKDL